MKDILFLICFGVVAVVVIWLTIYYGSIFGGKLPPADNSEEYKEAVRLKKFYATFVAALLAISIILVLIVALHDKADTKKVEQSKQQ
jgi:hypothetical protein